MSIRGSKRPSVVPITAPSFPVQPRPYVYRKIAYTFIACTVLMVIAVLWLSSVRANVTVQAKHDHVALDGVVDVAKTPQAGQLPGRVVQITLEKIQEFEVKDSQSAGASSTATLPPVASSTGTGGLPTPPANDQVLARGTVRIINTYSRAQTLVRTTRLLTTDGKLYRLDKTINVPAGGEVKVDVYADQVGSQFVIGPSKFTIPGLWIDLQKFIYAQSDTAFVAGTAATTQPRAPSKTTTSNPAPSSAPRKVVTADNIAEAQALLKDVLFEQAKKALSAEATDPRFGEVVYITKVVDPKTNVSAGQAADTFLASIKLDVTAIYFSREDMLALVRTKLRERVPEGREFLPFADQDLTFTPTVASARTEVASIQVHAAADYRLTSTSSALQKSVIAGKSKQEALTLLRSIDGVQDAKIEIHPGWMSKVPALKDHIDLKIE